MASGDSTAYGNNNGLTHIDSQVIHFDEHDDLLAVYGWVVPDKEDFTKEHIASLGFIRNSCPMRDMLYHEEQYIEEQWELKAKSLEEWSRRNRGDRDGRERGMPGSVAALITILSIISLVSVLMSVYLCLKHRGKICKKK